jgi:hypothetical protein
MPKASGDHVNRNPCEQQDGGMQMTKVMQAGMWYRRVAYANSLDAHQRKAPA